VTAAAQMGDRDRAGGGQGVDAVAAAAAQIAGVAKVLVADDAAYAHALAENVAPLVVGLMAGYDAFVAPATTTGKNIAPRVAALLDVAQVSEILSVEGPKTFTRPIYAGNAIATVEASDAKLVVTVRATAFDKAARPAVRRLSKPWAARAMRAVELRRRGNRQERAPRTDQRQDHRLGRPRAQGRGNLRRDDHPAGRQAGRRVGASRAAVDAGYVPNDYQVGQTGKIVAPEAYIAVGISGAIQHLAGMKDSKTIIAINKDEDAPIFQVADVGLVADLFEAVPELVGKL
jgi:electron transfer flavoprotein alpha subunit